MRIRTHRFVAGASLAVAAAVIPAQTTLGAEATDVSLEEIVVTARRRDESLQDVPQTVNAVTADAIEKLNLLKLEDVQAIVPGLTLSNNNTGFGAAASMRGVSFEAVTQTSPTVEFYLNDAPAESNLVFQSMYDLGQIEVLRGPQGTLRGRASPSGAITVTTRKADLSEFGGYTMASGTDQNGYNVQGALNVPIVADVLAVRVAGLYDENEFDGVTSMNNDTDPKQETNSGRVSLRYHPTDSVEAQLSYQYLKRDLRSYVPVAGPGSLGQAAVPAAGRPGLAAGYNGPVLFPEDRRSVQDEPGSIEQKYDVFNASVDWRVAGQRLSYVGGYRTQDLTTLNTVDAGNLNPGIELFQMPTSQFLQRSHELRLASEERVAGLFDYTVGAFYAKQSSSPTRTGQAANYNPGAFGGVPNIGALYPEYVAMTLIDRDSTNEEKSAFASVTWHITDDTEFTAGGRYIVSETSEFTGLAIAPSLVALPATLCASMPALGGTASQFAGFCDVPIQNLAILAGQPGQLGQLAQLGIGLAPGARAPIVNNTTKKPFVYNVQLSHHFDDDLMAYANVGSSWRRGLSQIGIFPADPVVQDLTEHPPEKSRSYEVGLKSSFLDDRARVNVALYHQDFDGLIFRSTQPITYIGNQGAGLQLFAFQFNNSADAVVDGVDLDASLQLNPRWNITLAASYADGHVDDDVIPCNDVALNPSNPQGTFIGLCKSDATTSAAPQWNASLQSEYFTSVMESMDAYIRGVYTYYPSNDEQDFFQAGSYGLLNLYLGVRSPDNAWDVTLFAKNLTDSEETLGLDRDLGQFQDRMVQNSMFAGIPNNVVDGINFGKAGYLPTRFTPRREIGLQVRFAFGSR